MAEIRVPVGISFTRKAMDEHYRALKRGEESKLEISVEYEEHPTEAARLAFAKWMFQMHEADWPGVSEEEQYEKLVQQSYRHGGEEPLYVL